MRSFLPTGWEGRLAPASGTTRLAGWARAEEMASRARNRTRTVAPLVLLWGSSGGEAGNGERVEEARQGDFESGETAIELGQLAGDLLGIGFRNAEHDFAGEGGEAALSLAIAG